MTIAMGDNIDDDAELSLAAAVGKTEKKTTMGAKLSQTSRAYGSAVAKSIKSTAQAHRDNNDHHNAMTSFRGDAMAWRNNISTRASDRQQQQQQMASWQESELLRNEPARVAQQVSNLHNNQISSSSSCSERENLAGNCLKQRKRQDEKIVTKKMSLKAQVSFINQEHNRQVISLIESTNKKKKEKQQNGQHKEETRRRILKVKSLRAKCCQSKSVVAMWPANWRAALALTCATLLTASLLASLSANLLPRLAAMPTSISTAPVVIMTSSSNQTIAKSKALATQFEPMTTEQTTATLNAPHSQTPTTTTTTQDDDLVRFIDIEAATTLPSITSSLSGKEKLLLLRKSVEKVPAVAKKQSEKTKLTPRANQKANQVAHKSTPIASSSSSQSKWQAISTNVDTFTHSPPPPPQSTTTSMSTAPLTSSTTTSTTTTSTTTTTSPPRLEALGTEPIASQLTSGRQQQTEQIVVGRRPARLYDSQSYNKQVPTTTTTTTITSAKPEALEWTIEQQIPALRNSSSSLMQISASENVNRSVMASDQQQQQQPARYTLIGAPPTPPVAPPTPPTPLRPLHNYPHADPFDRSSLESALKEALDDLVTNVAPSRKTPSPGPAPAHLFQLHHQNFLPLSLPVRPHHQQQPQQLQPTASQSAPSISLPPISHFLSPRNPFKLFASASSASPISTRYWPRAPSTGSGSQSAGSSSSSRSLPRRWFGGGVSADQNQKATPETPPTPPAQLASLDLMSLQDIMGPPSVLPASATPTSSALYAHSSSADQLEQLVRAASQAGHLPRNSAPILPAIVSGPNGQTFAGYYIPAIEPLEETRQNSAGSSPQVASSPQESQISELIRHHHDSGATLATAASSAPSSGGDGNSLMSANGLLSTIPGTDYILHPDEVRAMIDIGESAWRNNQQHSTGNSQLTAASNEFSMTANREPTTSGLMQENHLENLRNYAYVESRAPPPTQQSANVQHLSVAASGQQQRRVNASAAHGSQQQLDVQLNRALARARQLPAIIRVNDQNYIHWPLIQTAAAQNSNYQQQPIQAASSQTQQQQQQQQQAQPQDQSSSPVRLATQLTPGEIRQVEDSILETLIMAQTLQHQRKIMEALAAAASVQHQQQVMRGRNHAHHHRHRPHNDGHRLRPGFFGRRRRRRSNSATAAGKQQTGTGSDSKSQLKQAASGQHLVRLVPPTHLYNFLPVATAAAAAALPAVNYVSEESRAPRLTSTVMADQDTNRRMPSRGHAHSAGATLQTEASEQLVFGNRVLPAPQLVAAKPAATPTATPTLLGSHAPAATQYVTFVPVANNRHKHIAMYTSQATGSGETQTVAASMTRAAPNRIEVDWPAMTSDADYFPPTTTSGAGRPVASINGLQPVVGPHRPDRYKTNELGDDQAVDNQIATTRRRHKSPPAADGAGNLEGAGSSFSGSPTTTLAVIQPQSTRRGHYVTSQTKLQFAQDYQAREGVPIYNNNVRVAGALDRQRSLASVGVTPPLQDEPHDSDETAPKPMAAWPTATRPEVEGRRAARRP